MNITTPNLNDVNIYKIDYFEWQQYDRFKRIMTHEEALQVIINNTEGDFSQLSPELYQYAKNDTSWTQDV